MSVVVKQAALSHAGNEEIGEAIVIEIADRDAHPVNLESRPARRVTSVKVPSRLFR